MPELIKNAAYKLKLQDKHFLMLTYAYPPFKAVGSFRSYYVAEELQKRVGSVKVITTKNYAFLPFQEMPINSGISVKRVYSFDYNFVKGILSKYRQASKSKTNIHSKTQKGFGWSHRILDTFPFNIIIGLGGIFYIFFAFFRALPYLNKTTHIYSSFRPYSDHVVAFLLKTIKPSLFWIADFRDIHIDSENLNVLSAKYQHAINRFFFRKANVLTTVSEGYLNPLRQYNSNSVVLSNGYNDSMVNRFESVATNKNTNKFRIAHVGSLYNGRRDPTFLFKVISSLVESNQIEIDDLQFSYAGPNGQLWYNLLEENGLEFTCQDLGLINHEEAIGLQKSSDINLMITWATKQGGTFPAKFFEYLVAQKPILTLINGERDIEFEKIFDTYNIGQLGYNNDSEFKAIADFVLLHYNHWKRKSTSELVSFEQILSQYHWNNIICKLLEITN